MFPSTQAPSSQSPSTQAGAPVALTEAAASTEGLRRLYYARSVFAFVWAGSLTVAAATLNPVSVALLVLYPLFDLAAAVVDLRSSGATRSRGPLLVNAALSLLAALALGVAVSGGIPGVLRVWGAWAVTAGIVQLVVGIQRRGVGGQVAMILSGAISVLAGGSFMLMATAPDVSLAGVAGYATLGGIFFLVSAIRMHRARRG